MGRNVDPVQVIYPKLRAPCTMLHCPRCSGPLQVKEEQEDTRLPPPHPMGTTASAASTCPSGHLCPHEQQQISSSTKASVYLSGGGIINSECSSKSPLLPPRPLSLQEPLRHPHQQNLFESQLHHQQQHFLRPASFVAPPRLELFQQQQQQQCVGCQQQLPHLAQNCLFHHPQVAVAAGAPSLMGLHQQQSHLVLQQPSHQQHIPLFITSTIHQPVLTTSSSVFNLSQPPTPAIVVASTGSPFFSSLQQHQSRPLSSCMQMPMAAASVVQQQPLMVNLPPVGHSFAPSAAPPPTSFCSSPISLHEILSRNRSRLEECGWFYPSLTWNESAALLENTAPGTFLVRESGDIRFLFSLSVQRSGREGPTSVRIHFKLGKFKLDAEEDILHLMPEFDSVLDLIDHYLCPKVVAAPSSDKVVDGGFGGGKKPVWLDSNGQQSSHISLKQPLYQNVSSLGHLSRLAINGGLAETAPRASSGSATRDKVREAAVKTLGVPKKLEKYLTDYPNRA